MQIGDYENLVFFDTETTGFDAKNNQIIELAAILVKSGEVAMQMDEFIKLPEGEVIPEKIVELTHITDEMLRVQGKSEETVLMMFAYMIAAPKTLLIAHNAQFDLNFIGQAFMRHREGHKEWLKAFCYADYLDTLTVFKDRRAYPHKLENAINCYHLEDKVVNSHRAVDDCLALYEVTKAMADERDDLIEYVNIFGYNPKYGLNGDKLRKVIYGKQFYVNEMTSAENIFPNSLK